MRAYKANTQEAEAGGSSQLKGQSRLLATLTQREKTMFTSSELQST